MSIQVFQKILKAKNLYLEYSQDWVDSESIRNSPRLPVDINVDWSISPPKSARGGISISHSQKGGLILLSEFYQNLGVDIEIKSRLRSEVIERVSLKAEVAAAPNPQFLWVAKEASFKTLSSLHQDAVITNIHIKDWSPVDEDIWSFKSDYLDTNTNVAGYLLDTKSILFAASFLVSQ